jgi:hypothetical protein
MTIINSISVNPRVWGFFLVAYATGDGSCIFEGSRLNQKPLVVRLVVNALYPLQAWRMTQQDRSGPPKNQLGIEADRSAGRTKSGSV